MPRSRRQKRGDLMAAGRLRWMAELKATPEHNILNTLIQPDKSAVTVADALRELDSLTPEVISSSNEFNESLGNHAWHLFNALLEIVGSIAPPQQSKYVDFLVELQKRKVLDPTTGETLKVDDDEMWTALPTLGYSISDANWNGKNEEYGNAFLAQLTVAGVADFSLKALWACRTAFEEEVPAGESAVRTACWWYIYMADRMWANVENGRVFQDKWGFPGDKYKKKKWTGYNHERWVVWEEGLLAAQTTCKNGETKKLIQSAISARSTKLNS